MYELTLTTGDLAALADNQYNANEVLEILAECSPVFDPESNEFEFQVSRSLALEIVELGAKEDYAWPGCGDRLTRKLNSFCEVFFV